MRIYKRKGSPNWWATWNDQNGKRHRRSSGTEDQKLAEALVAQWVQDDFFEEHFGKKPDLPFGDALVHYAKAQKRDHPRHFMSRTRYRLKFLAERFKGLNVSDFTFGFVQAFVDERLETVSSGMALKDVAYIKAIINKARREGRTDFVPNFPRIAASKPRSRWLTHDEEERLVLAAADHLKPLIRIAVDTGGRRSELLGLDWRHVELDARRIVFVGTKNGEDRTVRLCERAVDTLTKMGPKNSGPVFTYNGKSIKCVKVGFGRACERAGIEDLRFHDLRHTFASRLVQSGVPLYEIMHLTGHKSLAMVQRYAHLAPDFQERAIKALDSHWHDLGTVGKNDNAGEAAKALKVVVPMRGLEPRTYALRMRCSTS